MQQPREKQQGPDSSTQPLPRVLAAVGCAATQHAADSRSSQQPRTSTLAPTPHAACPRPRPRHLRPPTSSRRPTRPGCPPACPLSPAPTIPTAEHDPSQQPPPVPPSQPIYVLIQSRRVPPPPQQPPRELAALRQLRTERRARAEGRCFRGLISRSSGCGSVILHATSHPICRQSSYMPLIALYATCALYAAGQLQSSNSACMLLIMS